MKELITIQNELKAPKSKHNKFGNYNYRSAEDILESVKPLLMKYNCLLTISDELVQFGERVFVKATAEFTAPDGKIKTTTSYAEHAPEKKGMDVAQVTGSASSYARKYALNGLLLIDDGRDADDQNAAIQTVAQTFQHPPPMPGAVGQIVQNIPSIPPPPPPAKR